MKRLSDYTKQELVSLTDEEYSNLVDLECMCAGAPLSIESPLLQELPDEPQPDVEVYKVAGIRLTHAQEAQDLSEFLEGLTSVVQLDYHYGLSSDYKYVEADEEFSTKIMCEKAFSKDYYDTIEDTLKAINKIKKENMEITRDFKDRCKARRSVIDTIDAKILEAKKELDKLQEAKALYEKYKELSGGNEEIAGKFFKESEYADLLSQVLEEE